MGVVLESVAFAETALLKLHPELGNAKIFIHFHSSDPKYKRTEYWNKLAYWSPCKCSKHHDKHHSCDCDKHQDKHHSCDCDKHHDKHHSCDCDKRHDKHHDSGCYSCDKHRN